VHTKPPPPPPPPNVSYRFLTNPNLIIIYARTCAARRVQNIHTAHKSARRRGGGCCRTTVFGRHNPSVLYYIDIIILYYCCACAGTGCRYNDNSYCCILYTPAGPIVRACGGGAARRRRSGRTAAHLDNCHPTTTMRPLYDDYNTTIRLRRRRRHRHTCDTLQPPRAGLPRKRDRGPW